LVARSELEPVWTFDPLPALESASASVKVSLECWVFAVGSMRKPPDK
jgi:hypothetical protein